MTRRVVGIDMSMTRTGIGIITLTATGEVIASGDVFRSPLVKTGPLKMNKSKANPKLVPTESLHDRRIRAKAITADACRYAVGAELVVIEGLFAGMSAGHLIDRSGVWWRIVDRCLAKGTPVAVIAPAALKKPITGRGGSAKDPVDKAAMAAAVLKLWPGLENISGDLVDAVALAHLGAVLLRWPVETLQRHQEANWTELPPELLTPDTVSA